jgi:hypothetical protein
MQHVNEPDIWSYVNRARREIAQRTQSIRRIPQTSGAIVEIDVINGGFGYQNPVVFISAPDAPSGRLPYPNGAQATATAQVLNTVIQGVTVTFGGAGYFQPTAQIIDFATPEEANLFILGVSILGGPDVLGSGPAPPPSTGTGRGATLQVIVEPIMVLQRGQEEYAFPDFPFGVDAGVKSAFAVNTVSVIYANWRYRLLFYAFSEYQAFIRQFPFQYEYVPTVYTQFGQGADGTLLMYPLPSQQYRVEIDTFCLPADLVSDQSPETLPEPWTDAVPYKAVSLAYEELQNLNAARYFQEKFDLYVLKHSQWTRIGKQNNPFGRY